MKKDLFFINQWSVFEMSTDTKRRDTRDASADATVGVLFFVEKRDVRRHGKARVMRRDRRCVVFCQKTRLTGCPLTRKGEILETRPSVCCFLSKKRDVRRHGKARVMRRDRGESDLENAKNRVLLCLLACCCLNKVFEHFRGRKI